MIDPRSGIWSIEEAARTHFFDESLAQQILEFFPVLPESIADLGCGRGDYCRFFRNRGCQEVDGYEGTPGIAKLAAYKNIKQADLSRPIPITKRYDLVLCLEVGEHIPAKREDTLIQNINALCRKALVISWAVPGQAGVGHVNCRTNNYVVNKINDCGFTLNLDKTDKMRSAATLPWFKETIFFFTRR